MTSPESILPGFISTFALIRTPLHPLNSLFSWYQSDRFDESDKLKFIEHILCSPDDLKAIYIASPVLYNEVLKLHSAGNKVMGKKMNKIFYSLFKYWIRMCSRPTPFGLFASYNAVKWEKINTESAKNSIEIYPVNTNSYARVDMEYLVTLYFKIEQSKKLKRKVKYYANSTLCKIKDKWTYIKINFSPDAIVYDSIRVKENQILANLLVKAKNGDFVQSFVESIRAFKYSDSEAEYFIDQLIENQIIVSELYPNITGPSYQDVLLDKLKLLTLGLNDRWLINIVDFLKKVKAVENIGSVNTNDLIELESQAVKVHEYNYKTLFNVTSTKNIKFCSLKSGSLDNLPHALRTLYRLSPPQNKERINHLANYISKRFGSRRISLMSIFDQSSGFYYSNRSTELDGPEDNLKINWNERLKYKFSLYRDALVSNAKEIDISNTTPDYSKHTLPKSFYVFGTLVNDNNYSFQLISSGSPSAISLMTRFSQNDPELKELIGQYAHMEGIAAKPAILAEISHLPQARVGNILARPDIREYEIVYMNHSLKDSSKQILVDDLQVQLINGEIVLYSLRLNQRIIPINSSSHTINHASNLPVYQFLCDLQYQNDRDDVVFWDWEFLSSEPFLPRVSYKNIILTPAKWNIASTLLTQFSEASTHLDLSESINAVAKKYDLPVLFYLKEGDSKILINRTSEIGRKYMIQAARKGNLLQLEEYMLESPTGLSPDPNYVTELLIPFVDSSIMKDAKQNTNFHDLNLQQAYEAEEAPVYLLGSEWLYCKIYASPETIQQILTENINVLTEKLFKQNIVDKWFFIRYVDSGYHLRLRYHLKDASQFKDIITELNSIINQSLFDGLIFKVIYDAYKPEIDRFGGTMQSQIICETFFSNESFLALRLFSLLEKENASLEEKVLYALKYVSFIFDNSIDDLQLKIKCIESYFEGYAREFNLSNNIELKFRLNDFNIRNTNRIDELLYLHAEYTEILSSEIQDLLTSCFKIQSAVISKLRELSNNDRESYKVEDIIGSLVHLFCNRFFVNNPRENELLIYYCYRKYLRSLKSRNLTIQN